MRVPSGDQFIERMFSPMCVSCTSFCVCRLHNHISGESPPLVEIYARYSPWGDHLGCPLTDTSLTSSCGEPPPGLMDQRPREPPGTLPRKEICDPSGLHVGGLSVGENITPPLRGERRDSSSRADGALVFDADWGLSIASRESAPDALDQKPTARIAAATGMVVREAEYFIVYLFKSRDEYQSRSCAADSKIRRASSANRCRRLSASPFQRVCRTDCR